LHNTASFLTTGPYFSEPANKKPAYRIGSAAGKHLIQMDLPLAWREPSPPDRVRCGAHLEPHLACWCALHRFPAAPQL